MSTRADAPPLDDRQRRIATLLAAGRLQREVAKEVGCSEKTVQRLKAREDFRLLVKQQREALVPDTPTAEAVLLAALTASRKDGTPDWQTRVAAARALMSSPVASPDAEQKARETRVYMPAPGAADDDGE